MDKRTKIVATIGPSSWDPQVLRRMINAGMNVARVNGAFADVNELERVGKLIRSLTSDIALMLDIKGHEVRLNKFQDPLNIKKGDEVIIGSGPHDPIYPITYPEVYKEINIGQIIYVDKGEVTLKVAKISNGKIYCEVLNGLQIKGGKGMNFPGAKLGNPAITDRDVDQIRFVTAHGWEFVAASFIRNKEDIITVKKYLKNSETEIIAKIEDQQGIDNFDEILEESYGIMIARGDMGSEIPLERLPFIQKEITYRCNQAGKPVITATNMLESMTEKIFPTRAEVTDVANAVLDGTDAIMTSGETSSGKYPVESIETMSKIAHENEQYLVPQIIDQTAYKNDIVSNAIANAAFEVTQSLSPNKIIVVTQTGNSARFIARLNLPVPIHVYTINETRKRQLLLTKGLTASVFPKLFYDRDEAVHEILKVSLENSIINSRDKILLVGRIAQSEKKKPFFAHIFEYIDMVDYIEIIRRS